MVEKLLFFVNIESFILLKVMSYYMNLEYLPEKAMNVSNSMATILISSLQ